MSFNYYCHNIDLAENIITYSGNIESQSNVSIPSLISFCGYVCSAFENGIATASPSASSYGNDCVAFWDGARADFPWPFAASNAERATAMRYENNFISGGSVQTDWPFGQTQTDRGCNISDLSTASWSGWTTAEQLGFCGPPAYVGSIRGPVTGINAFIPSGDSLGATGGDYNATIIFTGWNGEDVSNFPLLRFPNRRPYFIYNTGPTSGALSPQLEISVGGTAGNRYLSVGCGAGSTYVSKQIHLGTVGEGRWFMLRVRSTTTLAIIPPTEPGDTTNNGQVTVRATGAITSSDGVINNFSVVGYLINGVTTRSVVGYDWSTNFGAAGGIFFSRPSYFYMSSSSGQASFAYLGFDQDPELSVAQLNNLSIDFLKTFTGFSGPCVDYPVTHSLFSDSLDSTSEVSTPTLGQIHAITADDLEAASELSQPLVDINTLTADNLESISEVTSPTLAEV